MSGLARSRRMNWIEEALRLVVTPRGETADIVAKVKEIVAKMNPEEVAEFRQRIREINERPSTS
jgi:hypothetical protein